MPLPELTHLQFAVLACLLGPDKSGREIRAQIAKQGGRKSGPAFYQLMARMEDAGLVEGWYAQRVIAGQIIKERRYRAKGAGLRAFDAAREFYAEIAEARRVGVQHA